MEWISVKERVPSETGNVIGKVVDSGGVFVGVLNYYICPEYGYGLWEDVYHEDVETEGGSKVTHWMPMPPP